jgi:hypothetical protein
MSNLVTRVPRFSCLEETSPRCTRCLRRTEDCNNAIADKEELCRHCEGPLEAWRVELLKKAQK